VFGGNASHAWLCNALPSPMSPLGTKCLSWWHNRFGPTIKALFRVFHFRWDMRPFYGFLWTGLPHCKARLSRFSYTKAPSACGRSFWLQDALVKWTSSHIGRCFQIQKGKPCSALHSWIGPRTTRCFGQMDLLAWREVLSNTKKKNLAVLYALE
jgi:hypothetical protein